MMAYLWESDKPLVAKLGAKTMKKQKWLDQDKICQELLSSGQTTRHGLGYKAPKT